MQNSESYYRNLFLGFIREELSMDELRELFNFIRQAPEEYDLLVQHPEIIEAAAKQAAVSVNSLSEQLSAELRERVMAYTNREPVVEPTLRSRRSFKLLVAASVVILLGIGLYFYISTDQTPPSTDGKPLAEILAPATNRAMITLADGSRVYLDSLQNGQLSQVGSVRIVKLANGQIAYQAANGKVSKDLQYNTLFNPRGSSIIDVQLSDGTRVWLNAGSTITYPVAFAGNERKVELKGEGYFEVAKDPSRRFIVNCNGIQTEVLGTHFNINGFAGESSKVTLLQGAIKVTTEKLSRSQVLKPGEQALVGETFRMQKVDVNKVMAWKYGSFSLDGLPFAELMHQIERWYNVEVVYASGVPDVELFGKIGRDLSLSEVARGLTSMGVNCRIEQGRLVIRK